MAAEGYDNRLKGEIRAGKEAQAETMLGAKSPSQAATVGEDMPYRVVAGVRGHSFQELLLNLHLYTARGWPYRGGAERLEKAPLDEPTIHGAGYLCGRPQRALQATSENSG